jgi:hypothetical protein
LVFLDEALWAGDRKGEGVLKALITEPRLQLEAKFRDPVMVVNRLRIIAASNNDWFVPAGMGDRRWFILDVADTFAGTDHPEYWNPLYREIENGGAKAMFYDLLNMDLSTFDVRAVPHTAAKAHQQAHSLRGVEAWVHHILQEGAIGCHPWQNDGVAVGKAEAYQWYVDFTKQQRDWRPDVKSVWSKKVRELLGQCVDDARQKIGFQDRVRVLRFAPLSDCRRQFALRAGAPKMEWEPTNEEDERADAARQIKQDAGRPVELETPLDAPQLQPVIEPDDAPDVGPEPEPEDGPELEWEPVIEPEDEEWES